MRPRPKICENLIQQRLSRMQDAPRSLVQAASPYRLTELGAVARKTGLGSTALQWIVQELEEILNADPNAFATIRNGLGIDEEKLKTILSLALFDPVNLLDSFAIRTNSKSLFGVPISRIEQNIRSFLSAVSRDSEAREAIRTNIRGGDLDFLCQWINGASYSDLVGFFLNRPNPTPDSVRQGDRRCNP